MLTAAKKGDSVGIKVSEPYCIMLHAMVFPLSIEKAL
jgi:hypothetical protein